jgi:ubiquinol-cytochrome c reductase cytochrome c1 subunit
MTRLRILMAGLAIAASAPIGMALAAGGTKHIEPQEWHFEGVFGTHDRAQLQRGYLVYKEVCAACHRLNYVQFRHLVDIGFSEAQAKTIASEFEVEDGPNDDGDMFTRPAGLSDNFPPPFANDKAARASNNGALPPNLSLITKARPGGANYVFALLTGFGDPPSDLELADGMNFNPYFTGSQIAMAPPLSEDAVEFADGTKATTEQMARDVVAFLAWAAEPRMEDRHRLGFKVMVFLIILTILLYLAKQRVWRNVH